MLIHSNTNLHSNPAISSHIQALFWMSKSPDFLVGEPQQRCQRSLFNWDDVKRDEKPGVPGRDVPGAFGWEHLEYRSGHWIGTQLRSGQQWQVFVSPSFLIFLFAMRDGECSVLKCLVLSLAWIKSSCFPWAFCLLFRLVHLSRCERSDWVYRIFKCLGSRTCSLWLVDVYDIWHIMRLSILGTASVKPMTDACGCSRLDYTILFDFSINLYSFIIFFHGHLNCPRSHQVCSTVFLISSFLPSWPWWRQSHRSCWVLPCTPAGCELRRYGSYGSVEKSANSTGILRRYPLVNIQKAIENGHL